MNMYKNCSNGSKINNYSPRNTSRRRLSRSVKKAKLEVDLLGACEESLLYFTREDVDFIIQCITVTSLSSTDLQWAFHLLKENMKEMYEQTVGWDADAKLLEISHDDSRFLIVREKCTNFPIAFSVFRFDMDYGEEVLYCYELHVSADYQGMGIGGQMLSVLENISSSFEMKKIILTVFKANQRAIKFYRKARFKEDDTSPKDEPGITFPYIILSKYND